LVELKEIFRDAQYDGLAHAGLAHYMLAMQYRYLITHR